MTNFNKINSSSITEQCYRYMIDNKINKLNIYDFLDYIKPQLNMTEEEYNVQMSYFYTDLNLDGRFVCMEDGSWVLKDTLTVEDVLNFTEPSISKFGIDEDIDLDMYDLDEEDIIDEVDALIEDEDNEEDNEDLYGFEDGGIVPVFGIDPNEEEF